MSEEKESSERGRFDAKLIQEQSCPTEERQFDTISALDREEIKVQTKSFWLNFMKVIFALTGIFLLFIIASFLYCLVNPISFGP